jgi:hypothetical protein
MANPEHLANLEAGVDAWNAWRRESRDLSPDLSEANLSGANLSLADLRHANLRRAKLIGANLSRAGLIGATLQEADLSRANLSHAILMGANVAVAELDGADLSGANLIGADLSLARLSGTDFTGAFFGRTTINAVDLSQAKGLSAAEHELPSSIGIDSVFASSGNIPETFLKGAGVPDVFIAHMKALVGAMDPIQFYSCFISYSSKDQDFAERLYADLQAKGVRCWYAPEDMKIGDEIRPRIDEAIRLHEKLLLVLSSNSIRSTWVKKEVETAFERESRDNRVVLFPIRLDADVMETDQAWAADIRTARHIGDFTGWRHRRTYTKALDRLLRDLVAASTAREGNS